MAVFFILLHKLLYVISTCVHNIVLDSLPTYLHYNEHDVLKNGPHSHTTGGLHLLEFVPINF